MEKRELFFEFATLGDYTQVRVIDSASGIEVSVPTPVNMTRQDQMRLGTNKMRMVLRKHGIIQ